MDPVSVVTFFASAVLLGKATLMGAVAAVFGSKKEQPAELEVEAVPSKDIFDDYSANARLTKT